MENYIKIHYYIKNNRLNLKGEAPIYLRVTVNSQRFEMSTHKSVLSTIWDNKKQRLKGNSELARTINNHLIMLETKINKNFNHFADKDEVVTARQMKDSITGKKSKKRFLLDLFNDVVTLIEQEKGNKYSNITVQIYHVSFQRLKQFIQKEYHIDNIEVDELNYQFMEKYEIFLRTKFNIHHNTTMKYLKHLKKVIHEGMKWGFLDKDPFFQYKTAYKDGNRTHLSQVELDIFREIKLISRRLQTTKDIFLFICNTGLSYSDLARLSKGHIHKGIEGYDWIIMKRAKTDVGFKIPLLPEAIEILNKYKNDPICISENKLLPIISNQKTNSYLDEIAKICSIDKSITCHVGRHTFATTVTLSNGIPIETVQKMLGHKEIQTTQIYSKVVDQKIADDMKHLMKQSIILKKKAE